VGTIFTDIALKIFNVLLILVIVIGILYFFAKTIVSIKQILHSLSDIQENFGDIKRGLKKGTSKKTSSI
jgi:hypothetical protein